MGGGRTPRAPRRQPRCCQHLAAIPRHSRSAASLGGVSTVKPGSWGQATKQPQNPRHGWAAGICTTSPELAASSAPAGDVAHARCNPPGQPESLGCGTRDPQGSTELSEPSNPHGQDLLAMPMSHITLPQAPLGGHGGNLVCPHLLRVRAFCSLLLLLEMYVERETADRPHMGKM